MFVNLIFERSSLLTEANTGINRVVGVPWAPPSVLPSKSRIDLMPAGLRATIAKGGWFQI
jgi:hypothetical protein